MSGLDGHLGQGAHLDQQPRSVRDVGDQRPAEEVNRAAHAFQVVAGETLVVAISMRINRSVDLDHEIRGACGKRLERLPEHP